MGCCWDFSNTKDRSVFEKALQESIEIFGVNIEYWRVSRNAAKDPLYNEDSRPLITDKWDLKAKGSTFDETYTLSRFGIESQDEYIFLISKTSFEEVAGDGEVPYEGDYIYLNYQDRIFQIADVKDDKSVFLQNKFAYELTVRPADISGEETTANIGIDDFEDIVSDIDDSATIEALDDAIVTTKADDSDPFGDWT